MSTRAVAQWHRKRRRREQKHAQAVNNGEDSESFRNFCLKSRHSWSVKEAGVVKNKEGRAALLSEA